MFVSLGKRFQKYFDSKLKGNPPVVQSYSVHPEVDELSIIYGGDTAIAFGSSHDFFKLSRGLEFPVDNRWTATSCEVSAQTLHPGGALDVWLLPT